MKLYKVFEDIIFEEVLKNKLLLNESVSIAQIEDAIKNKYHVHIMYEDPDNPQAPPTKRYIEVYALGDSKAGNKMIRAWQMGGPSKTTKGGAFKTFRVDRIRAWMPTKIKWSKAISDLYPGDAKVPKVNKSGDKTMKKVDLIAKYVADMKKSTSTTSSKVDDRLKKLQQASVEKRQKKSSYIASGSPKPTIPTKDSTKKAKIDTSKTTSPEVLKKNKK